MKVLTTFKFTEDEFKSLRDLGYEIIFKDEKDVSFSHDIEDIDILVTFDCFNKLDIDKFPNLKWIQLLSAGINQVPEDKIRKRNILLTNNRGGYSIPIAEWIVLKTLEMFKNSKEFFEKQQNKIWKPNTHLLELYGKTIGFVGTGSIAQEAAKRFEAFGVNIIGINTRGREVEHFHKCYGVDKIKEAVGKCDVVVVATPYTDKTYHLIDKDVLDSMKEGAYIVNIARGVIIDEKALIESLRSGKIKKAALDVFEVEPLPEDSPLWDMDNVYISPHNSWSSEMVFRRRYEITYKNLKRYRNNEELINVIDLDRGY